MELKFTNDKEVFDYVRQYDLSTITPPAELFLQYDFNYIDISALTKKIEKDAGALVIDARSEKEFEETNIPHSVNFPLLNNDERHYTGLVYAKYNPLAAAQLAKEYSDPKIPALNDLLKNHNAHKKEIIVHCWRGGGRSKYLAKMISDCGYKPAILIGGIKSYRNLVNSFFSEKFPYPLVEINGLTGTGKTEVLNFLKNKIPVLDIELAARHFSSLFGHVPYKIRGYKPIVNQTAFENELFAQYITQKGKEFFKNFFVVESESRKIGDFYIPMPVYDKIVEAKTINVTAGIESRANRLIKDYIGDDNEGLSDMLAIFSIKERFFRKELSNKIYEYLLNSLKAGNVLEFATVMLKNYYDIKYKDKGKTPLHTVSTDNIVSACNEILEFLSCDTSLN